MAADHSHSRDHADCTETIYRLYEYLDGELTAGDAAKIAGHLSQCRPCMEQHDVEQMVKSLVQRSCGPEQAPMTLRAAIVSHITTIRIDPLR